MTDKQPFRKWQLLSREDILEPGTGALYLRRWRILQTPWFGILLHAIHRPDRERHLHDHPWSFVSIVLRGGYWERRPQLHIYRRRFSVAFRRATDAHRITHLDRSPTWTLVLTGRKRHTWGFHTEAGRIPYYNYAGLGVKKT